MKAQSAIWWFFVLTLCSGGPIQAVLVIALGLLLYILGIKFQLWFHEYRKRRKRKKWRAKLRARGILPPDDNS